MNQLRCPCGRLFTPRVLDDQIQIMCSPCIRSGFRGIKSHRAAGIRPFDPVAGGSGLVNPGSVASVTFLGRPNV